MIVLLFLIAMYFFKIYLLGKSFYIDDENSYINIAASDGAIILFSVVLFYFSKYSVSWLKFIIKIIISLLSVFYVIDIFVIFIFNSRFYFDDLDKFYLNIDFKVFNLSSFIVMFLFLMSIFMLFFNNETNKNSFNKNVVILIPLSFFLFNYDVDSSVRSSFFKNYILVNLESTYDNEYSNEFIETKGFFNKKNVCEVIPVSHPKNIIIFVFESWSYYHSELFGADNDWTPELDTLAERGMVFKNFYANGFTTEAGLYALLTGEPLLPYNEKYGTDGALGLNNLKFSESFTNKFNEQGYNTKFITSGSLGFLEKGRWLESLGFKKIIGNESFDVKDRKFLFGSVSDEKLYDTIKNELYDNDKNFIVVENVNTHQPFYYPDGDKIKQSEENAFKYADEQLANTIKEIFNKDTMIIVMSDHRALAPVTIKEKIDSKKMAVSRVPMFILWNEHRGVIDLNFQQTDVLPSVTGVIDGLQCTNQARGAIFPVERMIESKCVYHARGDNRSMISVMCDNNQFDVVLDGDQSKALVDDKNNRYEIESVNYINHIRIDSYIEPR